MAKQIRDIREHNSIPLLIAAHCSTIRRKAKRLDINELSAILDDFVRELSPITLPLQIYLNSLNKIVTTLNSNLPPILLEISSHYFFIIIRNTIRDILQQLCVSKKLNEQETYILRNCVLLIHHIVLKINDVSRILHWITDATFLDALANCLNRIDKISKKTQNQRVIKQITRLLGVFCNIQERLPLDFHQNLFVRLLQPTINCLTSSTYMKIFQNFKSNADSFTENQKLFLIKCPYFLTTYNGPHIEKTIEQVLEIMLTRYVSILDEHMKTIKKWNRPIMRAIHNLIITIAYAEGYFSSHTTTESFRALINHLLNILNEPTLINKIQPNSNNIETLLIDATLVVFSVLVYESDALDYIKRRKPTAIFRQLTKASYESIALNAYMMLAYTMDDNDIKTLQTDLTQLFSTTISLLRKTIETRQQMNIDQNFSRENVNRNILQLLETLKGLVQYEQIRNEIIKQDILIFLIDCYKKVHGLSRQILLECLWKLSFNEEIAQQLREHSQFIHSLENIPKLVNDNIPQNTIRRSNSYGASRNSTSIVVTEATNYAIQKAADGLLWKIVKEPQFREKIIEEKQTQTNVPSHQQEYNYEIMISYCYADKDIVYKIQQFLANEGYKIWFDRDHNNGLTMDIVAEAMENSEFVIICMSDSYKRDDYCQLQAECALISKRNLLPLIVHNSYKPDGWLKSIISDNIYIDFGKYDFKAASELLLKEIKQRQHKKETLDVVPTVSTPIDIVRNPSGPMNVSYRPYIPVESSALNGATSSSISSFPPTNINRQQQGSMNSTSSPTASGSIFTVSPVIVVKEQQASIQSISTPSIPDSFSSNAHMIVNKQQQPTAPIHPISRPLTPGTMFSTISTTAIQQQQQQQQQLLMYPVSRSSTPGSIASTTYGFDNKLQQQQLPMGPSLRSLSPSFIASNPSAISVNQQQQTLARPISEPLISNIGAPAISTAIDKQQQQTSILPVSRSSTPGYGASTAPVVIEKQPPQESVHSVLRSSTPGYGASTASVVIEKQPPQESVHSVLRSSTPGYGASTASVVIEKQPPQESVHSVLRSSTPGYGAPTASVMIDKQPPQESVHSVVGSSASSTISSDTSVNIEKKQQQPMNSVTRASWPSAVPSVASAAVVQQQEQQQQQQQQQRTPSRANSRSTTPGALPVTLQTNGWQQPRLPEQYTNRNTHNSTYRGISMNAWRNNDVLDYLFDSHLYPMMPLCESMSGKALLRLFRMCQRKPSRVYDQLNEELRMRFNGLALSMGVYTQFLIEMDSLVGPALDALPPRHDSTPKIMERVIFMPHTIQQQQRPIATQPSPAPSVPSSISSLQSKTMTPADILSGTTTPRSTRLVERAIYRPASNVGRPYNFIIESVEEPNALLDQVQRYGEQLLLLDETNHYHREINSFR